MPRGITHVPDGKVQRKSKVKKAANPTIAIKGAKRGATNKEALVGHEARMEVYIARTLALKRLNYYHYEIAEEIAKEFDLVDVPAITTIATWLQKGRSAIREDIEELAWQMRLEAFQELDRMKRKFLQIACADELQIKRWAMIEGEMQPVLDENAVKEQLKAGQLVVQILARQAKLLGMDLEKSVTPQGEGPQSLSELHLWLIGNINAMGGEGKEINITGKTLELKSGIPELDSDSV